LTRKSALISPNLVVAGSGNGNSAQRVVRRLFASFENELVEKDGLADVLSQVDDMATPELSCTLIGWLVTERWQVASPIFEGSLRGSS